MVRAVFPGGSITGAAKIRAMEIIDELEPNRRSLYTGAIGYFSRGGSSAFNIAIRTILVEGDRASFQVGGAIVADSDPEGEFEETLVKGRGMRDVLDPGNENMLWSRGELVADDALMISALDRTFEHGLGLFETFRTWNGHPTLLHRHLDRLQSSARELGLPLETGQLPDSRAVAELIAASRDVVPAGQDARLRITLSGGLATNPPSGSVLWMSAGPLALPRRESGVVISGFVRGGRGRPARPAQDAELLATADQPMKIQRRLDPTRSCCLTDDGRICEASRSNIFLVEGGRLVHAQPRWPAAPRRHAPGGAGKSRAGRPGSRGSLPAGRAHQGSRRGVSDQFGLGCCTDRRAHGRQLPAPGPRTRRLGTTSCPGSSRADRHRNAARPQAARCPTSREDEALSEPQMQTARREACLPDRLDSFVGSDFIPESSPRASPAR